MISAKKINEVIRQAGFPLKKRAAVTEIINFGLEQFREYKTKFYYSHTGKKIKKPRPSHTTKIGRYDQKGARTILISRNIKKLKQIIDNKSSTAHQAEI